MRMSARLISLFTEFLALLCVNLDYKQSSHKGIYSLLLDASEDLDVEEDEGEERNEAGGEEPEPVYVEPSLKMFRSLLQEKNI